MSYRDPAGFFCTAEMLLGLILKDRRIDLERHKDFLSFSVRDLYESLFIADPQRILLMLICLPYDDRVKEIIEFGKENNISEQAWLEAIERRAQNGS